MYIYVHTFTQKMVDDSVDAPLALSSFFPPRCCTEEGRRKTEGEEDGQSERKNTEKRKERGRREKQKVGWMPSLLSATPWGKKSKRKGDGLGGWKIIAAIRARCRSADRPTDRYIAIYSLDQALSLPVAFSVLNTSALGASRGFP